MTSRALLCTARAHGRFCGRLSRAVRCMSIGEAPRLLRGAGQGNCVARAAVALSRLPLRAHAASEERLATGLDPAAAALDVRWPFTPARQPTRPPRPSRAPGCGPSLYPPFPEYICV